MPVDSYARTDLILLAAGAYDLSARAGAPSLPCLRAGDTGRELVTSLAYHSPPWLAIVRFIIGR
jgi:hypothetical protein